ncbi:MAG: hypothetical protein CBC35_05750 [Planctomycetes bacterium TMED75]|nr:aspartate ammonia-lyase [Planctomycetaceae bacterium]OUU93318.1 MAG: hypothetical protein CBC35_05750 [Planctomycetes bacterium TMED75]
MNDSTPDTQTRTEQDSMGSMEVPHGALFGATTQRAVMNFQVKGLPVTWNVIHAFLLLKRAAASANYELNKLDEQRATLVTNACTQMLSQMEDPLQRDEAMAHFPVDVFQTGSGTSTNMNVNEVLANLASIASGNPIGAHEPVHPNDHVNMGQSSNDTFPTAMNVSGALLIRDELLPALHVLHKALLAKSEAFDHIVKIGRTHLQDATPIRLGQEFSGFAAQIEHSIRRVTEAMQELASNLPIGGTAVGTGINTHPQFGQMVCAELTKATGLEFSEASNHFEAQSTIDSLVDAHGRVKTLAVSLSVIASNIRLMACGPRCGLNELSLPAVQPGSSIMPGKVNPVILESLMQVCMKVAGNDNTISLAGMGGLGSLMNLNVALPLAATSMLESIDLLANSATTLVERCLEGLEANSESIEALVERSLMLGTALVPEIGYNESARIAKACHETGQTIRQYCLEHGIISEDRLTELLDIKSMTYPQK